MALNAYDQLLKSIQNTTMVLADTVPIDAPTIKINWSARELILPSEYSSFLGVQNDHQAETIYFEVDRYFENVDLSKMTCVVEYVNSEHQGRVYPVVDMDTTTSPDKLYFGWRLSRNATRLAGKLHFAIRFYSIDDTRETYVYNLSTLPCTANIYASMYKSESAEDDSESDLPIDNVHDLLDRITALEHRAVRWHDLILVQ